MRFLFKLFFKNFFNAKEACTKERKAKGILILRETETDGTNGLNTEIGT